MASTKTVNAENLQKLGAAQLAALLLDISAGDAGIKRRLRLALAGTAGPAEAAREVAKRLASIARSKSFIDWHKIKPLAADLKAQHRAICDLVAPHDPGLAFDLVWQMLGCAGPVYERSDDSNGELSTVFDAAIQDLGPLAQRAALDPVVLATRVQQALCDDRYGAWNGLVPILAPHLGQKGLTALQAHMKKWGAQKVAPPPERERKVIGWGSSGKIYADELDNSHRRNTASFVLKQIAESLGDVDGYIAQFSAEARTMPRIAADIARHLLAAGRAQEAWQALAAVEPHTAGRILGEEWQQARIDALEALGRAGDAQDARWRWFAGTLNPAPLRAHLRKLPDFEDFDVEQRALAHVAGFADAHRALWFLVEWPDLARANDLVLARGKTLDGNLYEVLSAAADALQNKHPLAATILRRAMIDFTLSSARSSRYKHAARHLYECAALAAQIEDFGGMADHATYQQSLRTAHGRKAAFWQELAAFG